MTIIKHKKHPRISKPSWGKFGRNEVGVLGAPCGVIENWVQDLREIISSEYSVTYFDVDHDGKPLPFLGRITDQISHHSEIYQKHLNESCEAPQRWDVARFTIHNPIRSTS